MANPPHSEVDDMVRVNVRRGMTVAEFLASARRSIYEMASRDAIRVNKLPAARPSRQIPCAMSSNNENNREPQHEMPRAQKGLVDACFEEGHCENGSLGAALLADRNADESGIQALDKLRSEKYSPSMYASFPASPSNRSQFFLVALIYCN